MSKLEVLIQELLEPCVEALTEASAVAAKDPMAALCGTSEVIGACTTIASACQFIAASKPLAAPKARRYERRAKQIMLRANALRKALTSNPAPTPPPSKPVVDAPSTGGEGGGDSCDPFAGIDTDEGLPESDQ